MTSTQSEIIHCVHCGDRCPDSSITEDDQYFCCNGCRMVNRLLKNRDRFAGELSAFRNENEERFRFLDQPEFRDALIYFSDHHRSKTILFLPAIHCSSCIYLLENLSRIEPAILSVRVDFLRREASIDFDPQRISLKQIAQLLSAIGYEPDIHLSAHRPTSLLQADRQLYIRLGIAGFCAGNMMLFAFPDYLAGGQLEPYFYTIFSWLNFILAFPVLYSASDYFRPALAALREKTINMDVPIALGIIALFSRSAYEVITASGTGYFDSLSGLVFFLLVGKVFQKKTYRHLSYERDYRSYFPLAVTRLRRSEGQVLESVAALHEIEPGDRLRLRHGEIIPADSILMSPAVAIDYSFITGESNPVKAVNGDRLMAGGKISGASVEVEVIRPVSQSYLTQLWNQIPKSEESVRYLSALSARVATIFTWVLLAITVISGVVWYWLDSDKMWFVVSSVLIIACPCALALTLPFSYGAALRVFGRSGFYLKNANLTERIAAVNHVVFDKTGTLTHARAGRLTYTGRPLTEDELNLLRTLVSQSTHPLSRLIEAEFAPWPLINLNDYREEPGKGIEGEAGGLRMRLGRLAWLSDNTGDNEEETVSRIHLAINGTLAGYFSVEHRWREGLDTMGAYIQSLGLKLSVLSGDSDQDRAYLQRIFGYSADMRFRKSPYDKLELIRELRNQGDTVMMVGDGLNDAGALQEAAVGVAVTDQLGAFTPKSDAILHAASIHRLPDLIRLARAAVGIVYMGYGISFLYNAVGITFAVLGFVTPLLSAILMPLSSVSVVALSAGMVYLTARRLSL